jgi:hypothetical protein
MLNRKTTLPEYLSTLNPAELAVAKSHLFNIFRANPWLSRFYADGIHILASNHNPINNLQTRSENFFDLNPKGSNPMPLNKNIRFCTHIKVNGIPCGSPALRGEVFCYFHQRMIRGVRTPAQSRLHPIALIENEEGIQASLMEVINALVRNTIDLRRAQLILRALHIAVKNSPRVHFQISQREMVREVPDYPAAPAPQKPASPALDQAGALARIPLPKPATIAPPRPATPAAALDPARRKPPAPVTAAPPARKSANGRSG